MDNTATDVGALSETVVFLNHFNNLPDPRQRKVIYPLDEVLLLALLAVLAGAESFVDIPRFGCMKPELLWCRLSDTRRSENNRQQLAFLVSPVGLEPTAPRLKVSCSTN
jgi:DDE_Tnp_1-associated